MAEPARPDSGTGDELLELFTAASAMPAAERQRFLDQRCAGRPALQAELASLLEHATRAGDFLERPAADLSGLADPAVPSRIGPYQLVQRLGAGGFGEVWRAEQREPIVRSVAIKLIRPGIVSATALQRFAAERQALALLEHPGIARIHDAGTTRDGRPWYAMELVEGPTLTEWCRRRRLGLGDRVRLLIQVCEALHHAHERGIVHRDLKPSNVLIAERDGRPQPKVIDFGIAKLREADVGAAWRTQAGQVIGTPAYMSPEQARGEVDAVDARTDVHALGVLLFELVTGTLPFEPPTWQPADLLTLQRRIVEEDAPRPSARIDRRSGETDPEARPPVLARAVRGDLDWIVLRALAKDPAQRYPSAAALRTDLERFLRDKPVSAGPPSRLYRLRKWVRRHRALAAMGLLAAATAVIGALGTVQNLLRAQRSERVARAEADKLRVVADFLRGMLASADPEQSLGADLSVRELLDRAARDLDVGLAPEVEAALRHTIGSSYRGLDRAAEAERHLRRALELADRAAASERSEIRRELALLFAEGGRLTEARALAEQAVRNARETGQPLLLARALEARGIVEQDAGDYASAEVSLRAALAAAEGLPHPGPVRTPVRIHLGGVLERQGRYADAEQELTAARQAAVAEGVSGTTLVLLADGHLAQLHRRQGRTDLALAVAERCVELASQVYGEQHAVTARHRVTLADLLQEADRLTDAERECRAAIAAVHAAHPAGSTIEAEALGNLGWVLSRQRRTEAAEQVLREALALRRRMFGDRHPSVAGAATDLAVVLRGQGDLASAEQLCHEALGIYREALGEMHRNTAAGNHALGVTLMRAGRHADAEGYLADAVRIGAAVLAADHWELAEFRRALGYARTELKQFDSARDLFTAAHQTMLARHGPEHRRTVNLVKAMIDLGLEQRDFDTVAAWRLRLPEAMRDYAADIEQRLREQAAR